jgi:nitroimidazol reductase NimA-like FMN-containing flavoprotein (pyridoxamine 5'-phosphate oxidase superfamily)
MEDLKEEVLDYLSKRKFLTLATSSKSGEPLTHPIAYINIGENIYFSTNKNSRKVKNIEKNPNIAFSVYDETEHLDEIRLVQMEGKASKINNEKEIEGILEQLQKKFPAMTYIPIDSDVTVIKITPTNGYFSDYNKRFGHRNKVEF